MLCSQCSQRRLKSETGQTSLIMLNFSLLVPVSCVTVVTVFFIMERLWEDDGNYADSAFQAELRVKLIFRGR